MLKGIIAGGITFLVVRTLGGFIVGGLFAFIGALIMAMVVYGLVAKTSSAQ